MICLIGERNKELKVECEEEWLWQRTRKPFFHPDKLIEMKEVLWHRDYWSEPIICRYQSVVWDEKTSRLVLGLINLKDRHENKRNCSLRFCSSWIKCLWQQKPHTPANDSIWWTSRQGTVLYFLMELRKKDLSTELRNYFILQWHPKSVVDIRFCMLKALL